MKTIRMLSWLSRATSYVRFGPDRRAVYSELYGHMLERNQGFLDSGMDEAAADEAACRAMGDPDEVGRELAKVHKPFWGRCLRLSRVLLILLVALLAATFLKGARIQLREEYWVKQTRAEGLMRPQNVSVSCGSYRFHLKEACGRPSEMTYLLLDAWTWNLTSGRIEPTRVSLRLESGEKISCVMTCKRQLFWWQELLVGSLDPVEGIPVALEYDRGGCHFTLPISGMEGLA